MTDTTNEVNARDELKNRFVEGRGVWDEDLEPLLRADPDFFETYLELAAVPWRTGSLEPKIRELVLLAVNATASNLYERGVTHHVRAAVAQGASFEEVLEVLELISVLGMHTMTMGVPVLLEVLEERGIDAGIPDEVEPTDERRQALKEQFIRERGKWAPLLEKLLLLDPDFFSAYLGMAAAPWRTGTLHPRIRELLYIAIDVNTTHLYEPGLRHHIRAALDQGAEPAEILEVFELVSEIGIHTMKVGLPVLNEETSR